MDPLSITFGVIGTAGVTLHSARRVYELIADTKGAPRAIASLLQDIEALKIALEALQTMLRDFNPHKRSIQYQMLPTLQKPLNNCTAALFDIETKVKPYVKRTSTGKLSAWRGFTWAFREKDVIVLQSMLMSHKQSLDIAISIAD